MELSFLNEKSGEALEEKKDKFPLETFLDKKVENVVYDKGQADLEQQFSLLPSQYPYVRRAIDNAWSQNLQVLPTLKDVLIKRANRERVVSFREADIMLRNGVRYDSPLVIITIRLFGSFLCEDDEMLKEGVFVLRLRYNKGLEWKNKKREKASVAEQQRGDKILVEIREELKEKGFPLHREEIEGGINAEFLKPEYLTWDQTNAILGDGVKFKTLNEKQEEQRKKESVK